MRIVFDLEGGDTGAAFFALYAGLRMYKEQKQKTTPVGFLSFPAAEAHVMLETLKEKFPAHYREAEQEFADCYSKNK